MNEADDDRLAERSRRGDARALGSLYCRHAPPLLRYLRARGLGRDDAEDILHETFVRLLEGRGSYVPRGRFRAWLFTVATRLAIDRSRQRQRRAELAARAFAGVAAAAPDAIEATARSRLVARIEAAVAALPVEYAVAFQLRVRDDLSYRDMAAISGEPEGTLRSRVHHAIRRLRDRLRSEFPAQPVSPQHGTRETE